jgi:DNA repair photolyase
METKQSITSKQILTPAKSSSRWFGVDFNANLYVGCENGCVFCDSKADSGCSDYQDSIHPVKDAIRLLDQELQGKPEHMIIGLGQRLDPYNSLDPNLRLTRGALEVINNHQQGVVIFTKSDLVLNDIDLLKKISLHSPVVVILSITTMNDEITRKLEPGAASTVNRFKTLNKLSNEKIKTGILMVPIVPFINDTEDNVTGIIRRAKEVGVDFIYPAFGITLHEAQRKHFYEMIDKEFPGLKNIYMDTFGSKASCQSPVAAKLKKSFVFECKRQKLKYGMSDIVKTIRPVTTVQMKLF